MAHSPTCYSTSSFCLKWKREETRPAQSFSTSYSITEWDTKLFSNFLSTPLPATLQIRCNSFLCSSSSQIHEMFQKRVMCIDLFHLGFWVELNFHQITQWYVNSYGLKIMLNFQLNILKQSKYENGHFLHFSETQRYCYISKVRSPRWKLIKRTWIMKEVIKSIVNILFDHSTAPKPSFAWAFRFSTKPFTFQNKISFYLTFIELGL